MQLESRVFQLSKDVECPEQNEDALRIDAGRAMAAVADGVTSGIFSGLWARILVDAVIADAPDVQNRESFGRWLTLRRELWASQIRVGRLSWFQKAKLREGAFSTLLWIRFVPDPDNLLTSAACLQACAVGDSCLFHVRAGQTLAAFPLQRSAEFDANPIVVGSVDRNHDDLLQFKTLDVPILPGDLLVLCTDALARWALESQESGSQPAWESYWNMPPEAWREEILGLRDRGAIRYDDTTLALLRVAADAASE